MVLGECCRKNVMQVSPEATVMEAIELMEEKNIGCVVVTERDHPTGIVTDRDLVLRVLGKGRNPSAIRVRDVMTKNPMVLSGDLGLFDAIQQIRGKSFRRIPVVDGSGRLVGIITLDDMIRLLTQELSAVATVLDGQQPAL
jgi:CBS domain-containing protein